MRFQTKLLLVMLLLIAGSVILVVVTTQAKVQEAYSTLFRERFSDQVSRIVDSQQDRNEILAKLCRNFAERPIVAETLRAEVSTPKLNELRKSLADFTAPKSPQRISPNTRRTPNASPQQPQSSDFRIALVDLEGNTYGLNGPLQRLSSTKNKSRQAKWILSLGEDSAAFESQQIGYYLIDEKNPAPGRFFATPIIDPDSNELLGGLLVGTKATSPLSARDRPARNNASSLLSTLYLDGALISGNIPEEGNQQLADEITAHLETHDGNTGEFSTRFDGVSYRVLYEALNPGSALPIAYHVTAYPLTELHAELKSLRTRAGAIGLATLLLGGLAAFLLSRSLTGPVRQLTAAAERIGEGDFSTDLEIRSKDELGQLGSTFNEMTTGLAMKERYRSVLDKVADREVADALVDGELELGGELREASILFCDIRGFTELSGPMPPEDVIALLNEHMTALTAVVYEHGGVVDKFVGDLIMAIFGVPKSYGDDAWNAARCALRMIEERDRLNQQALSEGRPPVEMGIGLATGQVVAGCMGSEDRLNYTVLGERVNLASRLCSQAGIGEVIIDQETHTLLADCATATPLPPVPLKGYNEPTPIFSLAEIRSQD